MRSEVEDKGVSCHWVPNVHIVAVLQTRSVVTPVVVSWNCVLDEQRVEAVHTRSDVEEIGDDSNCPGCVQVCDVLQIRSVVVD